MGFPHLSRWLWGKKDRGGGAASSQRTTAANLHGSPPTAPASGGAKEDAACPNEKRSRRPCSPADGERPKWQGDRWVVDREYDVVMVPDDVRRLSDADEIDWSIGWFEPHASKFLGDCDIEESFAVLVPCYRPGPPTDGGKFSGGVPGVVAVYGDNKYLDELLSSL